MKINKISSLIIIFCLFGCSSTQPESALTFTPVPTNTFQPTETPKPLPTSTSVSQPETTASEITITSKDKQIIIRGLAGNSYSLTWSEDGQKLFIGSQKNGLVIYDVETKKVTINPIDDLLISSLALKTLTVSLDFSDIYGNINARFIKSETGNFIKNISLTNDSRIGISNLTFSPNGKILVSLIYNKGIQIISWDIASGKKIKELFKADLGDSISGLAFSPDGNSLIAGFSKGFFKEKTFMVWDTNTWELQRTFNGGDLGPDSDLSFSPDGSRFATAGGSGIHEANIWDFNTGEKLFSLGIQRWGEAITYDPSGKYIASGGLGGDDGIHTIIIYDANTGKPIHELVAGVYGTLALAYSPDGTKLAANGHEGEQTSTVIIWDMNQP